MALTKISTGGVKDDTASQAKIADEAVDEARLQISNAGSNGQFLSKQSGNTGGLTWASVDSTPEGTVIKSTGESTAGKFLRTDGDNSCSWTTDAGQLTNINPQHISSGDLPNGVLATGIKADTVDETDLKISNAGTNGQYLQKQSGNTGGLTWADVNASPSVTANADGAIGAGDAVEMQANGTVKKIAATVATQSSPSSVIIPVVTHDNQSNGTRYPCIDSSPEGIMLYFFHDDDNSSYGTVRALKVNAGKTGFTFGDELVVQSNSVDSLRVSYLLTKSGNPVFAISYKKTVGVNSYYAINAVMVNASTLACTMGTSQQGTNQYQYPVITTYGSGTEVLLTGGVYGQASTYQIYQYNNSQNSVGNFSQTQGGVTPHSSWLNHNSLLYDPDRQEVLHFYRKESGDDLGKTMWLDIDGQSTISNSDFGSEHSWGNGHKPRHIQSCYDTENDRVVIVYTDTNSGDDPQVMVGTNNGKSTGTITWGTAVEIDDNESANIQLIFDPVLKKPVVRRKDDDNIMQYHILTINPSDNSVSVGTALESSKGEHGNTERLNSICYDTTSDLIISVFRDHALDTAWIEAVRTTETTTTSSRLLGFNQGAVTNGNAATIDLVGATNENQSSLTVGSKYYVKKDGSLSTTADTPSVEAGTAVAATKLVVKG